MTLAEFGNFICGTEQPSFLIFDFSTAPPLLFYSYVPIVLVSIIIALFIVRKDKGSLQSKLLFVTAAFFALWVINILVQWVSSYHTALMLGWQLTAILEIGMFLSALYFAYVFLYQRDIPFWAKNIFSLLIMGIAVLTPTILNVSMYDIENCEGTVGPLWQFLYAFETAIIVIAAYLALVRFKQLKGNRVLRQQVAIFGIGIIIFLTTFFVFNFYGELTQIYEFNLWGPLGMVAFLGLLAYLIVKFKTFNMKVIATQALVWALWIMIGAILFVAQTGATQIVTGLTEILAIIFGVMLIKSVKREVEQRERLEVLTKELSAANEKLKELDKLKSQFVSFASHDLKSPIALVKQFATLIYDGTYKEPQQIKETAFKIKTTADRAVTLVENFLDIRKIEEGKMEYTFEKKNIVDFVKGITNDFALIAKQKNIAVSFESASNDITVSMDTSKLRQVFQNFLDNSLKYMETSPEADKQGWIKVTVTEEQKTVLVTVKDSGIGMDKEILTTLFEQFHRDPSVAKKIQGTGLGLYISKQIVEAHHGETWAESEGKGKGSTFLVRIPKA